MWVIFHVSGVQYLKCLISLLHHKTVYLKMQAHPPLCCVCPFLLSSGRQAHQPWTESASAPCACVSSFWTSVSERARQRAFPPPCLLATRTITRVINNLNPTCTMQRYNFRNYSELRPNRHLRICCCYWGKKGKYCFGSKKGEGEVEARERRRQTLSLTGVFQLRKSFLALSQEPVNHRSRERVVHDPCQKLQGD